MKQQGTFIVRNIRKQCVYPKDVYEWFISRSTRASSSSSSVKGHTFKQVALLSWKCKPMPCWADGPSQTKSNQASSVCRKGPLESTTTRKDFLEGEIMSPEFKLDAGTSGNTPNYSKSF